jgi:hypothetical protein
MNGPYGCQTLVLPLIWKNLQKRFACGAKALPSKDFNLKFLSNEHMRCTKFDYVKHENFQLMISIISTPREKFNI